ncbi:MAG: hypothetical protein IPM79_32985 [Polyangiaceae bacterium]|jgi:hypothetical protein|nr:hypothetical protein [Polyangiaceae bacterium]
MMSRALFSAALASLLVASTPASAQPPAEPPSSAPSAPPSESPPPPPPAGAEALAKGKAALDAGRIDEACAHFQDAAAGGASEALLSSGQCHELQGKTATAWREYTAASVAAGREGAADREDRARALASKLAPRLSKLRVDVLSPSPSQVVKKNGALLDPSTYGALVPIDPGSYTITASAPGRADFSATVVLRADADAQVVVVPALGPPAEGSAGPGPGAGSPDGVTRTTTPLGVAGFVTTSLGALGIAMGTVFGVMALNEVGDAEEDPRLCPNKLCSEAGRKVLDEAETKGNAATAAFSIGGTALGAGVIIFLVRELTDVEKPASPQKPSGVTSVEPLVGPGFAGVSVRFH